MAGPLSARPTLRADLRIVVPLEPWVEGFRKLDQDGMEGFLETYARTILDPGAVPIAIVGLMVVLPGVGEAWAFLSEGAKARPFALVRMVRQIKERAFNDLGLWRMQAPIQERFLPGRRFAEACGLRQEARLASYFHPQEAAIVHAEVRP